MAPLAGTSKFNIGDTSCAISCETITRTPPRLAEMSSGWDHMLPEDADGRFFLDLDDTCANKIPYDGRGWTTFEWKVSLLASDFVFDLKHISSTYDRPLLDLHVANKELFKLGTLGAARVEAEPSTPPSAIVETKKLTNGKDLPFIKKKYDATAGEILGNTKRLVDTGAKWSEQDLNIFASEIVPMCVSELNVGGDTEFTISCETFTRIPSQMAEMFSGGRDHLLPKDAEGRFFLYLDQHQMRIIFNWLTELTRVGPGDVLLPYEGDVLPPRHDECIDVPVKQFGFNELTALEVQGPTSSEIESTTEHLPVVKDIEGTVGTAQGLSIEMDVLASPKDPAVQHAVAPDRVLWDSAVLSAEQQRHVADWLPRGARAALLFRASRDGFEAAAFHTRCDNQGATLVVALSAGGHRFGGFADAPWTSPPGGGYSYGVCRRSFLFRLGGPQGERPARCALKVAQARFGVGSRNSSGPRFGGGDDLVVLSGTGSCRCSFFGLGSTYELPAGGATTLAEADEVTLTEYEVFRII